MLAADDIILYDMIIGISDLINYHGSSVEEIKASFIDALGNHLRLREEIGKAPDTHSV